MKNKGRTPLRGGGYNGCSKLEYSADYEAIISRRMVERCEPVAAGDSQFARAIHELRGAASGIDFVVARRGDWIG
jgi:hypothetical protein